MARPSTVVKVKREAPIGPTTLCILYYLELTQTTLVMQNGAGANYSPTTFHGPNVLRTLDRAAIETNILELV